MTAVNVQKQRQERARVDSLDVVAVSAAAVLDGLEVPELTVTEPALPASVLPARAGLNAPGAVDALTILQASAETALEANHRPRPLVAVPTADMVSHTSFKTGSKFVIRVVPQPDNKTRDKNTVTQVDNDQSLYFDRASLQTTSEVHEERYQLFEAFDSNTLFLFGDRPKIWNFQFLVVNGARPPVPTSLRSPGPETESQRSAREQALEAFMRRWNMDFCDELIRRYERYYRGTAALKMRARVYLSYEDVLIEATLVGLQVARNHMTVGAANVGLTFVVHERSFLGDSLSLSDDASLAELLASEDQAALVTRQLSPSAIVPPKKSAEQLLAEYTENQELAQESQAQATDIQIEEALVIEAGASANTLVAELEAQEQTLTAQLEAETDAEARAGLKQQIAAVQRDKRDAQALFQESTQARGVREEELADAVEDNDVAVNRQRTSEAQLAAYPDADLTQSPQTIVYSVEMLTSNDDGTRTYRVWSLGNEADAQALAAGADPVSLGADLVDEGAVEADDPAFSDQADYVSVVKERVHT